MGIDFSPAKLAEYISYPMQTWAHTLTTFEEKLLAWALQTTDPNPKNHYQAWQELSQHSAELTTFGEMIPQLEKFDSVRQFVSNPFEQKSYWLDILTAPILSSYLQTFKNKSLEQTLQYLKTLEEQAFQYHYPSTEGKIKNQAMYLRLKNALLIIDRLAFQDEKYLGKLLTNEGEIVSELERYYLITSDKISDKLRGVLFTVEYEIKNHRSLPSASSMDEEEFVQASLSEGGSTCHGPLNDEAILRWTSDLRTKLEAIQSPLDKLDIIFTMSLKKNFSSQMRQTCTFDNKQTQTYASISSFDQIRILEMSDDELINFIRENAETDYTILDPEWYLAMGRNLQEELLQRGYNMESIYKNNMQERLEEEGVLAPVEHVDDLLTARNAIFDFLFLKDYYRLPQYALGLVFMGKMETSLEREMANPQTNTHFLEHDSLFFSFLSQYVAMSIVFDFPISLSKIQIMIENIQQKLHIQETAFVYSDTQPLSEATLAQHPNILVTPETYPHKPNWLENEWALFAKMDYQGVDLKQFLKTFIRTITLAPKIEKTETYEVTGLARGLFRNIMVSYADDTGKLRPVWQRLKTLAHEGFHNAEAVRALSGFFPDSERLNVVRERNARFFEAYVLEKYLWLRIEHQSEYPFSQKEAQEIFEDIIFSRMIGKTANWITQNVPTVEILDDPNGPIKYDVFTKALPTPTHSELDFINDDRIEWPLENEIAVFCNLRKLRTTQPNSFAEFLIGQDPIEWIDFRTMAEAVAWDSHQDPSQPIYQDFMKTMMVPVPPEEMQKKMKTFLVKYPWIEASMTMIANEWLDLERWHYQTLLQSIAKLKP